MRKTVAILLTLMMLMGIGTMALANTGTTTPPEKSTYEFRFQVPSGIISGQDAVVPVTFKTLVLGEAGYNKVRYEIVNTVAPEAGTVTFKAKDLANQTITFINYGTFAPSADFALPAQYDATTDWTLNFSKEGSYTISFKAYDENNFKIAEGSQDVTVKEGSAADDDDDEDEDGTIGKGHGKTHGLMNALRNHLREKNNGNKANLRSTVRLMELLQQRGVSLEEINEALKELEADVAETGGTDEDYQTIGKMWAMKGQKHRTYVDGKKVEFDVEPIVEKGRTLVPFRKIAEALGAEVEWIPSEQKVIVTKDKTTITITLGQTTATIDKDGDESTPALDVPAKIFQNRTLVPLRFLSEALDTTVDYYPEGALVVIKSKSGK